MEKPTGRRPAPPQKQMGKIGEIRRELEGKPCPSCGWHKYQLVIRGNVSAGQGSLFARCSHCQRPRSITADLQRILWV